MVAPLLNDDPKAFGKWRLRARLGTGGMGTVYLGSDGTRDVAVKAIASHLSEDPAFRARFKREIAICARVHGSQVADLVDSDPDARVPWFAVEYVDGLTLTQAVAEHGPLRGQAVRTLAIALLEGLRQIHQVGVIHRDLKPANIILTGQTPVIIDFGIARASDGTAITTAGFLGSAGWSSPEQVRGEPTTPASDIFSWALVVAFAATGTHPFGVGNAAELAYRAAHGRPDFEAIPSNLAAVLIAATATDPSRRPTVPQLISMLTGDTSDKTQILAADWETAVATMPWINETALLPFAEQRPRSRSRTALSTALALAVLTMLGAGAGYWWTNHTNRSAAVGPTSGGPSTGGATSAPAGPLTVSDGSGVQELSATAPTSMAASPTCANVEVSPSKGLRCRQALFAVENCGLTPPLSPDEDTVWRSVRSWIDAAGRQVYVSRDRQTSDTEPTLLSCGARTNGILIPELLTGVAVEAEEGWSLDESGQKVADLQCGPTGTPKRQDHVYVVDERKPGQSQAVCTVINQRGDWVGSAFVSIVKHRPYWKVVLGE
jgi:serine/threonine protein kinase